MKKADRIISLFIAAVLTVCCMTGLFTVSASAEGTLQCTIIYTSDYTALQVTPSNAANSIHYTLDGSAPTVDSALYTKKLGFRKNASVTVGEFDANGNPVGNFKLVKIQRICPTPRMNVTDRFDGSVIIKITDELEDAVIHYTYDGSDPTENSPVLKGVLSVKGDRTIKAVAIREGYAPSKIASVKTSDYITQSTYQDYIYEAFELTNAERAKLGLKPLKLNEKLCSAAAVRAYELSQNYENGHTRPTGKQWSSALAEYGYIHRYAAENYAKLDNKGINPEFIIALWMSSEVHRSSILNELGSDVGLGFVQADGYCYWVQLFGELM